MFNEQQAEDVVYLRDDGLFIILKIGADRVVQTLVDAESLVGVTLTRC